jgi:hypothetical protein
MSSTRANSRSRRLSKFRNTAECLKRGTISPTLVPPRDPSECAKGEAAARTSMYLVRMRFPSRATRCNSAPCVIRALRGKLSDALSVLRSSVFIWNTNRQLLPSLLAPTSKRCTTPLRFHTRTETVRLEPPCVARAVSWLSHLLLQVHSRQNLDTEL